MSLQKLGQIKGNIVRPSSKQNSHKYEAFINFFLPHNAQFLGVELGKHFH